jgi:hypothetical protein
MKRTALALATAALVAPAVVLAQQIVIPAGPPPAAPLVYPVPAPQAGISYYCANPQGWYPTVQACSAAWVAYAQPQPLVALPPVATPPAQAGVRYWCDRPQGWHPNVERCAVAWTPYVQPAQVVASPPAYVVVAQPPAVDPASAVYYVGPHRNAPYQSGIHP